MIEKALISDAKNISSVRIKSSIPKALLLNTGERSEAADPAKSESIVFIASILLLEIQN